MTALLSRKNARPLFRSNVIFPALNSFFLFSFFSLCLVISFKGLTSEKPAFSSFEQTVINIKQEKNSQKVAGLLVLLEEQLPFLSIKQQIIYYKLLASHFIEKQQYQLSLEATTLGLIKTKELASPSILISEILYQQGFSRDNLGDYEGALVDYKHGLDTAKSLNDYVYIAQGLINIGALHYRNGQYELALKILDDAYQMAAKTSDDKLKGDVNSELGVLYSFLEQNNRAIQYYQQAYQHYNTPGKMLRAHQALISLARLHSRNQSYQKSIEIYLDILNEVRRQNIPVNHKLLFNVTLGISWSYLRLSNDYTTKAYDYLLQAKEHLRHIKQPEIKLQFFSEQAYILFTLKKYQQALSSIAYFELLLSDNRYNFANQKQRHLNLLKLKADIYFQLEQYQNAYHANVLALSLKKSLKAQEQMRTITEVRLKLKSEQQDLENQVLENRTKAHNIALKNTKKERAQESYFLIFASILALIFMWLLVKLIQGKQRLKRSYHTDILTNIYNKRGLINRGTLHLKLAYKSHLPFSLLLFRLDNLKHINSAHGYLVADALLKFIAHVGQKLIRKSDVFGRFTGSEFIIIFPASPHETALKVATRFKESLIKEYLYSTEIEAKYRLEELLLEVGFGIISKEFSNRNEAPPRNIEGNLVLLIDQARDKAQTNKIDKLLLKPNPKEST